MRQSPQNREKILQKILAELEEWGLELDLNHQTCEVSGMRYRSNSAVVKVLTKTPPGKTLTKVLFIEE